MIDKNKLSKELDSLLNSSIDMSSFPYVKGNSIRIGKYVVRTNRKGYYKVFSCEDNKLLTETFSKRAALALAKTLATRENHSVTCEKIIQLDKEIQKWYNDCVFYKNTIIKTKDDIKRDIISTRYDIAKQKTNTVKDQLDKYIYS